MTRKSDRLYRSAFDKFMRADWDNEEFAELVRRWESTGRLGFPVPKEVDPTILYGADRQKRGVTA
jgi:hypothetical protein